MTSHTDSAGLPYVVIHVAVSLDGRTAGFSPNVDEFYRLASEWPEDATLVGSRTILDSPASGSSDLPDASGAWPEANRSERPLLAVVDSGGLVTCWGALGASGVWKSAVSLGSNQTNPEHLKYLQRQGVESLVAGEDKVDLHQAIARLHTEFGVQMLRVDSGGTLNGALLNKGLVSEVSLLVHPVLVGGSDTKDWVGPLNSTASEGSTVLQLIGSEPLPDHLLWTRYRVRPRA